MQTKISVFVFFVAFFGYVVTMYDKPSIPEQLFKPRMRFDPEEVSKRISRLQFYITQEGGTEKPFTGEYCSYWEKGVYRCVICDVPLFDSKYKLESYGWVPFSKSTSNVAHVDVIKKDVVITEARCSNCGSYLGLIYDDSPERYGKLRYSINNNALHFDPHLDPPE